MKPLYDGDGDWEQLAEGCSRYALEESEDGNRGHAAQDRTSNTYTLQKTESSQDILNVYHCTPYLITPRFIHLNSAVTSPAQQPHPHSSPVPAASLSP